MFTPSGDRRDEIPGRMALAKLHPPTHLEERNCPKAKTIKRSCHSLLEIHERPTLVPT